MCVYIYIYIYIIVKTKKKNKDAAVSEYLNKACYVNFVSKQK